MDKGHGNTRETPERRAAREAQEAELRAKDEQWARINALAKKLREM